jgi:hypothetical protein
VRSQENKQKVAVEGLMKDLMEKRDLNKDGKISFEELKKALKDTRWMEDHLQKPVQSSLVADKMIGGKNSSVACLVM